MEETSPTPTTESPSAKVPGHFVCPLSKQIMKDPVMDDRGVTYERTAIVDWYNAHSTRPCCDPQEQGSIQKIKHLVPNRALRELIYQHMGPEWAIYAEASLQPIPEQYQPPLDPLSRNHPTNDPRALVNDFLHSINRDTGKCMHLNDQGVFAFTYQHLTIVIEVPADQGSFFIYANLAEEQHNKESNNNNNNNNNLRKQQHIWERCLKLNYLQQETRGGVLSRDPLNKAQVVHSYTDRCSEITASDFRKYVAINNRMILISPKQRLTNESFFLFFFHFYNTAFWKTLSTIA